MAGETGGTGRDLPPGAPLISFHEGGGAEVTQCVTKMSPLTSLGRFSAIVVVAFLVLGTFRHLGALFLEGSQGLVPHTSGIISPTLLMPPSEGPRTRGGTF